MARNSMADMVNEASDVEGAAGGTERVVGRAVEAASGIGGAVPDGTDSVGSSSYCLAYGGTGDIGLADAAIGVE